jgi:hypothetical protein
MSAYEHIDQAAAVFIRDVLLQLSALVDRAGETMAREVHGTPDVYEVEACQLAIMHAITDFFENTTHDRSEDHIYGVAQPHHLRNAEYARAFFVRQIGRDATMLVLAEAE